MPQADRTWGAAGGGIPPTPGGEGAKRPEDGILLQIETNRFDLLLSAAVQNEFV